MTAAVERRIRPTYTSKAIALRACIGGAPSGKREIRGEWARACSGFVDVHARAGAALLSTPKLESSSCCKGVTSVVIGSSGFSLAPLAPGGPEPPGNRQSFFGIRRALSRTFPPTGSHSTLPPTLNAVSLINHNAVRSQVMGSDEREPNSDELVRMRGQVRRALEQGAASFHGPHLSAWASRKHGGDHRARNAPRRIRRDLPRLTCARRRRSPAGVGRRDAGHRSGGGLPCWISHHKAGGRRSWGRSKRRSARIDAANTTGADVTLDVYPYIAGSGR